MKKLLLPFIILITFYLESIFVEIVPENVFDLEVMLVPRFLTVLLCIMGMYYFRNQAMIYAAVFGLLFDVYYTEIIGIYLFLFPTIVYIASKITKLLQNHFTIAFIVSLLSVAIVEFVVYAFNVIVLQKSMEQHDFVMDRLISTLILNQIFFLFVFFPFKKLLLERMKQENHE